MAECQVFAGVDGQGYWHLRDDNNELVAQGEGYQGRTENEALDAAEQGARNAQEAFARARIVRVQK